MPRQDLSWMDQAACQTEDPEMFTPPEGWSQPLKKEMEERARKVCNRCPVIDPCLEYAIGLMRVQSEGGLPGVWGGLNEKERRKLWRQRRRITQESGG